jgi:hypothetical protein
MFPIPKNVSIVVAAIWLQSVGHDDVSRVGTAHAVKIMGKKIQKTNTKTPQKKIIQKTTATSDVKKAMARFANSLFHSLIDWGSEYKVESESLKRNVKKLMKKKWVLGVIRAVWKKEVEAAVDKNDFLGENLRRILFTENHVVEPSALEKLKQFHSQGIKAAQNDTDTSEALRMVGQILDSLAAMTMFKNDVLAASLINWEINRQNDESEPQVEELTEPQDVEKLMKKLMNAAWVPEVIQGLWGVEVRDVAGEGDVEEKLFGILFSKGVRVGDVEESEFVTPDAQDKLKQFYYQIRGLKIVWGDQDALKALNLVGKILPWLLRRTNELRATLISESGEWRR